MQDFDLDFSVNRDWAEFQRRLADHLAEMRNEDLLVLESGFEELDESEGLAPCIQFAVWDDDVIRCEVPSNAYLHPGRALSQAEQTHLVELGWNRPTEEPDSGSHAFFVDKKQSWSDQLAAMAVAVFRDIWGVPHPAFLNAETSSADPTASFDPVVVRPPSVTELDHASAIFPRDVDHLHELITLSLVPILGLLPERDPDGDVPIRIGNTILFIGPLADSVDVQLFAPLVHNISNRTRAAEVTADLNRSWSRIKFVLVDDRLSAFLEVSGNPFVPQHLADSCTMFSEFLRTVDSDFAKQFGGELFFHRAGGPESRGGGPESASETPHHSRLTVEELPKELLTLFHLDLGNTDPKESNIVVDICGHDRDQILSLLHVAVEWVAQLRRDATGFREQGHIHAAESSEALAESWERIVDGLRKALRSVVLPPDGVSPEPTPQAEQSGLFSSPGEPTLFDDPLS